MTSGITLMKIAGFSFELEDLAMKIVLKCVRCGSPLLTMSIHGFVYFFCPNCGYETAFRDFPSGSGRREKA
jgi:predicted RNA-binding Zn-ribbon protein involved in translation (DUF1610 family)